MIGIASERNFLLLLVCRLEISMGGCVFVGMVFWFVRQCWKFEGVMHPLGGQENFMEALIALGYGELYCVVWRDEQWGRI